MTRKEYLQKIAIEYIFDVTNNIIKINEAIMNNDFQKVIVLCNEGFARGVLYNIQRANCPCNEIESGTIVKSNISKEIK